VGHHVVVVDDEHSDRVLVHWARWYLAPLD
jgi:hypothetical protein